MRIHYHCVYWHVDGDWQGRVIHCTIRLFDFRTDKHYFIYLKYIELINLAASAQQLTSSRRQVLSVVLRKVDDVAATLVRLVVTVEFEIAAAGERDAWSVIAGELIRTARTQGNLQQGVDVVIAHLVLKWQILYYVKVWLVMQSKKNTFFKNKNSFKKKHRPKKMVFNVFCLLIFTI